MTQKPRAVLLAWIFLGTLSGVVTLIAYLPGMQAGFYLDDKPNIVNRPALHLEYWSLDGINNVLTGSKMPSRPLANISFALNHISDGLNPTVYHWTNFYIHLATGLSLFWVSLLLAQQDRTNSVSTNRMVLCSLAVTTIFLIHPINIQAVTYVVQRMTSMAAVFVLLSFGFYLVARSSKGITAIVFFSISTLCWLLAMASKETAIQLPLILILYEVSYHRAFWNNKVHLFTKSLAITPTRIALGAALILIILGLVYAYNVSEIFRWNSKFPNRDFTGEERVLTQLRVHFFYLSLLLWPSSSRLNIEHDFVVSQSLWEPWTTMAAVSGWMIVVVALLYLAIVRPKLAFPLLAYTAFHIVESGPINLEMVFEHRMYLPTAFLALFLNRILLSDSVNWKAAVLMIYILVLPLAYTTYDRNMMWSNQLEFLRDSAEKSPNNFRAWFNLGNALGKSGHLHEAEDAFLHSLKLRPKRRYPNHSAAHNNLGNVYKLTGRRIDAIQQFQLALKLSPNNSYALKNLLKMLPPKEIEKEHQR